MENYYIKLTVLVVVGLVLFFALRFFRGGSMAPSRQSSQHFKVKDRFKVNFQNELLVVEYKGRDVMLLSSQGDMKQVFFSTPDFSQLVK